MTHILHLTSSASGEASVSAKLTRDFLERWRAADPSLSIVHRDLGGDPPPHLTPARLPGLFGDAEAAPETAALADTLVTELRAADVLVIAAPMYNFGITTPLKSWFDHVLRAGITFQYTAEGPRGLLTGKRAIVVETRGGSYSSGPAVAMDAQEPHLRAMLGLMGVTDVAFVRAEQLAVSPDARAAAVEAALDELAGLVQVARMAA